MATKDKSVNMNTLNSMETASHYIQATEMEWQPTGVDLISMKILYQDDEGRSTILFKLEPGGTVPLHEHVGFEQTYVLEGSLEDGEGKCTAGNYVWRPAGSSHIAHAPNGAVILSIFTKPNRFMSGSKFYTEEN